MVHQKRLKNLWLKLNGDAPHWPHPMLVSHLCLPPRQQLWHLPTLAVGGFLGHSQSQSTIWSTLWPDMLCPLPPLPKAETSSLAPVGIGGIVLFFFLPHLVAESWILTPARTARAYLGHQVSRLRRMPRSEGCILSPPPLAWERAAFRSLRLSDSSRPHDCQRSPFQEPATAAPTGRRLCPQDLPIPRTCNINTRQISTYEELIL